MEPYLSGGNMNNTEKRDYEKERNVLIEIMEKQIPKEVKEAIEITISAQTIEEPLQINISHKGAFDAD